MICAEERLIPTSGPKSIVSFHAGYARLGEVVDGDDPPDAHVNRVEVIDVDHFASTA